MPVITPVAGLTLNDAGSAVALYVRAVPSGSLATSASEMAVFSALVWLTGCVSVGALLTSDTVQVKVLLLVSEPSETVAVTV